MLDARAEALTQAARAIERAPEAGAVLLIVGDAGIGKSTLVGNIAKHARDAGMPVVSTRWVDDSASPPMWAWSTLFRNWSSTIGPITALHEVHPLVRRLAPDVVEAAGLDVPEPPSDELTSRYFVGDAFGRLFAFAPTPVLVVLEDLHHAPPGGLGLLSSFAAAALNGPVVIVATSRPGDAITDLVNVPSAKRIDLAPLSDDDAAAVARSVNPTLDDDAVRAVVARAQGNPFFLSELARLGTSSSTTPAVRDVVLQRVDRLGNGAREVLAVAALLGPKPDVDVVSAVVGDPKRCNGVFDAAEIANLVELDGSVLRFSHDLVRDALVDALRSQEARWLHARIADVLRGVHYTDRFQVAHHLLEAANATEEAADAGEDAARAASEAGSMEDVLRWADRTAALVVRMPDSGDRLRRLDLLAGRALVGLGRFALGKERLIRSAEAALATKDGAAAADALLQIGAERLRGDPAYEPPSDLVAQALALVHDEPQWRCRLLGRSSDVARGTQARALADEALAIARATGDPDLIVNALGRVLIEWRDNDADERRAWAAELASLAPAASGERAFEAEACRLVVLLENGEIDEVARLVSTVNAAVVRLGLPNALLFHWTGALIGMLQGRFDEAEDTMAEFIGLVSEVQMPEALASQAMHRGVVACLRGEFGKVLDLARMYHQMTTGTPSEIRVLAFIAFIAAHAGDTETARNALERSFALGEDTLRYFTFGVGDTLTMALAEAACMLGDTERAVALEAAVRRYQGRMAVAGMAPVLTIGSADYVLALIARLRGNHDAALAHAESSLVFHRRMRAQPFEARSLLLCAELARDRGDTERSVTDARAAAKLAMRFEMRPTAERAALLLASLGAAPVRGAGGGGATAALVFTDIESSTQSAAALGDAAWMQRLREHDQTVRKLVAQHGGREIKHLGDGFMLTFPTAGSAVEFARALQPAFPSAVMRVRAGIHVGPVVEEDGDVFGTTVNVAARVAAAASGGETLVTDEVLAVVPTPTADPRTVTLKGVDAPVRLHPLS